MRWIVFDYGEVIGRRSRGLPGMARMLGVPADRFEGAYWDSRDAYDRGQSDVEYWRALGSRLGVEVDAARAAELSEADVTGWLDADPETVALLGELGAEGFGLALLSNAPSSHGRVFEQQPWAGHFQHILISGDLNIAKPDPEIWRVLIQRLAAPPPDCLFLDDKQVNVDGARTAGLKAERWTGATTARSHIAAF